MSSAAILADAKTAATSSSDIVEVAPALALLLAVPVELELLLVLLIGAPSISLAAIREAAQPQAETISSASTKPVIPRKLSPPQRQLLTVSQSKSNKDWQQESIPAQVRVAGQASTKLFRMLVLSTTDRDEHNSPPSLSAQVEQDCESWRLWLDRSFLC